MSDEIFRRPLLEAFDQIFGPARSRLSKQSQPDRGEELAKQHSDFVKSDQRLKQSQIAFENGNTACLEETIIPPTPELLASGEFEKFTADTIKGTVRSATTMRRVLIPHVLRLHYAGFIDADELTACRWYRDTYEATGLIGNIPASDYGREIFSPPQSRSMFTDWQVECQTVIRFIRGSLTAKYTAFFDAIVLHDIAPQKALRLAKKRNGAEGRLFAEMAGELADCYSELKR